MIDRTPAFQEYIKLDAELLRMRDDGTITEQLEHSFSDAMEDLWWRLSDEEQAAILKNLHIDYLQK